jgi:hypothetical protein
MRCPFCRFFDDVFDVGLIPAIYIRRRSGEFRGSSRVIRSAFATPVDKRRIRTPTDRLLQLRIGRRWVHALATHATDRGTRVDKRQCFATEIDDDVMQQVPYVRLTWSNVPDRM